MEEKHIKFLRFLIKKDGGFGYVQVQEFLLYNFEDGKDLEGRLKMKRFLDFMESENYIEFMPNSKKGIWITQESGKTVARDEISAITKIKPKGVELVDSYNRKRLTIIGLVLTSVISISTLIYNVVIDCKRLNNESTNLILTKQIDSLKSEINDLKHKTLNTSDTLSVQTLKE